MILYRDNNTISKFNTTISNKPRNTNAAYIEKGTFSHKPIKL